MRELQVLRANAQYEGRSGDEFVVIASEGWKRFTVNLASQATVTFGALVPPAFSQGRVDVYASPFITHDPDDLRWKCISCLPDP
ncbi:hypothetical protein FB566_1506 [Stackebrandtia endophytica]|uniref:Uncharacterized protein n=1 Tax=Stackebrandtia endophytica TaxID=1496996 RepID=A0A543ATY5_9ACTN|nr:hypothetical protein [Stackebrandtia endophytica]TQL75986.1 hypothetical protein FB566_1506 [Stackebrandtia endophytica]